ncbi:NAD(P)-dependent oxidoreductase (plasmid) [Rhizobium sp. CB3171]|uniref:NAD-dependent epimerase/dehydratase family protein n=1 Tax=unclassified Rhizobium TaxID=2613769 RepID=UPI000CF1D472|nr:MULTISPECIES: NAD(P)-dependent oxidoreductase [Rhizobium]UWU24188.1 NAD(P)-dependent oxidoreductase [Rhizobium tropici]WFU05117.1 NAD(P)-dependent oxidoreductase [Rhizobium sp. CB3171]
MSAPTTTRVLMTGSTGNLGHKATMALQSVEGVSLTRIGRNGGADPEVITANLEVYDEAWVEHFKGVDTVLHLAADPRAAGDWDTVSPLNIDLALNVLRAARHAAVKRFVFASSNWVLGGYRFGKDRLNSALPPRPVNPYGASKLFVERYGRMVSDETGMAFLSLRIGYCQPGENKPGPQMAFGTWGQQMWLGNQDWAQAVEKSVTSRYEGFHAINIVSRNDGMRWDLEEAGRVIGYAPLERHRPELSFSGWLKDRTACLREKLAPSGSSVPPLGRRW